MSYYSLSSKMVSTESNYSRFICRNNSSIRMSYKVCVQIKRSTIASMTIACMTIASSYMTIPSGSMTITSSSMTIASGSMTICSMSYYSFSSKMISSCSSYSRLINRNNSSIRMTHQAVEWSSRRYSKTGRKNL